ncbi:hypothetical protein ACFQY4_43700 [Catellatospora bangladeshensis]|uniref:Uncharacterized protein n=1 Tax=Catellatospora bangladeshensis TaxID=310355 RepID=A0A8J3JCR1_9ACTN|nr:hypothetical protein [Catellatospora bangladeshensis]GIF82472.1 hypothetical protein Cba03nite_38210 [Catellatospora bangladeshensis]
MDALSHLYLNTAGLLARVDDTLARWGAPETHQVWQLLRRTGALPGDAVAGLSAWSPQPWREQADELRRQAEAAEAAGGRVGDLRGWEGPAASAFQHTADRLRRDVVAWAAELRAQAVHLDSLARCLAAGRSRTARALARVAGSAEAVLLTGAPDAGEAAAGMLSIAVAPGARLPGVALAAATGARLDGAGPVSWALAAADVGAALLHEIDVTLTELDDLLTEGPAPTDEPGLQQSPVVHHPASTTLRVDL